MAHQARFIPKNPEKYGGDPSKIFARSSWEIHVMKFLDSNPAVLKWASEEFSIPYIKPTDGRVHKYYPDFVVVYRDKNGGVRKEILEVKPLKESLAEKAKSIHDKVALAINVAKWNAAEEFAKRNGMSFRVLTEQSLFVNKPKKPRQRKPSKPKGA
jgi:hypothetical protein